MVFTFHFCFVMMVKLVVAKGVCSAVAGNNSNFVLYLQEWHKIFGVSTGGNFGIYELYTSNDSLRECNASVADLGVNTQDHYKSKLLRIWDTLDVTRVKMSLFKDREEVVFIEFNGIGATSLNWMDDARLVNSSYDISDLQYSFNNFFSIYGHYGVNFVNRRFFINRSYGGCGSDYGWMFVLDDYANVCAEDRKYSVNIYYSPFDTYSHYSDFRIADSMVVYIQGESIPNYCCQAKVENTESKVSVTTNHPVLTTNCGQTTENIQTTEIAGTTELEQTTEIAQTTERSEPTKTSAMQTTEVTENFPSTFLSSLGPDSWSTANLESKLTQIKQALTIDKNTTVLFLMSKRCAEDPRYSAKVVGNTLGTGLLVLLGCLIILPDLQKALSFILFGR